MIRRPTRWIQPSKTASAGLFLDEALRPQSAVSLRFLLLRQTLAAGGPVPDPARLDPKPIGRKPGGSGDIEVYALYQIFQRSFNSNQTLGAFAWTMAWFPAAALALGSGQVTPAGVSERARAAARGLLSCLATGPFSAEP